MQDEPARTTGAGPAPSTSSTEEPAQTAATPSDSGIVVYNTPFGPMIKRPATASAATPSTTSTPAAASPTAGSAGTNAAANSAGTAAAPAVFTTGEAALEVLRKQFLSEGFDASGLNLSYAETQVYYPGGYFTNKLITLELGNGRKESYDVNLMLKNPWLTALEMRRFMAYST